MTPDEKKAEANRKRSESVKRAWVDGKGKFAAKKRPESRCPCGCGPSPKHGIWVKGHQQKGKKQSAERIAKRSESLKKTHARGAYNAGYERRKAETLSKRPLCLCGCGKHVPRANSMYANGCFDATTPENRTKARAARDWDKLRPIFAEKMRKQMLALKESGQLDEVRRNCGVAKGMPDHLAAKTWIVRDPYGNIYRFSNLAEWARQNQHRFEDDRPESKSPFWLRISGGIGALLDVRGRSCSYRGWVAVSKTELESGAADLLGRDNPQPNIQ